MGFSTLRMRLLMMLLAALAIVPFTIPPAGAKSSYYYIVNTATKMVAEVFAHNQGSGARVVLWPYYGGDSEQFFLDRKPQQGIPEPVEEQWFLLHSKHTQGKKCLKTNGYQSGAPVVQADCGGDASQLWRVRIVAMTPAECGNRNRCFAGQRLVLENYYDRGRRCLDAVNGHFPAPPGQGTGLQAWDCIPKYSAPNAVNQEWELVNVDDWNAAGPDVH
jgi:hypothetical protein